MGEINGVYSGDLLLVTVPWFTQEQKNLFKSFSETRKKTFFGELSNLYNINNALFPDEHPNQKGHQIISEDLYDYLTKNKIIPCN